MVRDRKESSMTLGEVLARARKIPKRGDHEIVLGPDGLAHILIITYIENAKLGVGLAASLGFMCPCMAFKEGTDVDALEVAPIMTCLDCLTR
jgi:hypothetical protein